MNLVFSCIFLACTFLLLCRAPDSFLSTLLQGSSKAATLCLSLLATYAVWMGLMRVWEDCGVARGVSRLLKPIVKRLIKTDDEAALSAVCMNFSANMLGISGAATPYGIQAAKLLDQTENAEYASAMFFALNTSGLQLFPSSLIAVRVALGSASPNDIILPTFLCTLFSTLLSAALTRVFIPPIKRKEKASFFAPKTKGVCTQ